VPSLGEANAVNVEATGGRAHYIDGVSEPYNGGTRHALSTEHQQYSTSNQMDVIREYAKRAGWES
jgi:hypothetical protein